MALVSFSFFASIGGLAGGGMAVLGVLGLNPGPVEISHFNFVELRSRVRPAVRSGMVVGSVVAVGLTGLYFSTSNSLKPYCSA